jgi:hypothetical protein
MDEHYTRAELDARVLSDGAIEIQEPKNVSRFALLPPITKATRLRLRIGGANIIVPAFGGTADHRKIVVGKHDGRWSYLGEMGSLELTGKRPGLQGPIDDAFTAPFLCVRGTGQAWNPSVQAWADANLKRFAYEWSRYFRGDLPIKDDSAVTDEDLKRFNLVLFGDPGSNRWIDRVVTMLPIRWTRTECAIGSVSAPAGTHAPVLIQPNPLARDRYVVINSGHTFHERELSTLNYLLFPRLADWAIVRIPERSAELPQAPDIVKTGFFDEAWEIK